MPDGCRISRYTSLSSQLIPCFRLLYMNRKLPFPSQCYIIQYTCRVTCRTLHFAFIYSYYLDIEDDFSIHNRIESYGFIIITIISYILHSRTIIPRALYRNIHFKLSKFLWVCANYDSNLATFNVLSPKFALLLKESIFCKATGRWNSFWTPIVAGSGIPL